MNYYSESEEDGQDHKKYLSIFEQAAKISDDRFNIIKDRMNEKFDNSP